MDHKIRLKNSLKIIKNRTQAFDYRICDDLCEVLLKYFPFEDKIKFECISKQFQRFIFNKQYVVHIKNSINLKAFESLLKKKIILLTVLILKAEKKLYI